MSQHLNESHTIGQPRLGNEKTLPKNNTSVSKNQVVHVKVAESKKDKQAFLKLPYLLYKDHTYWIAPLRIAEADKLNPNKNPFFKRASMTQFLAWQGDEVVGRIAVIDNRAHNQYHLENVAFFGFFEAQNKDVAHELYKRAEEYATSIGRDVLRGPVNPSMDEGAGFQISAFDTKPFLMMPYNERSYIDFVEENGYTKAKDLYAWYVDIQNDNSALDYVRALARRVGKRFENRLTLRSVNMKQFKQELHHLKRIYNSAWEDNWGFVKLSEAEFDQLAKDLKMIVDPDLAVFAEVDGEVVGVGVALPDANQVFEKIPDGRLLPFGFVPLLQRKRHINRGRLAILGVMGEWRQRGLELTIIKQIAENAKRAGYIGGECSWVLEDNDAMNKAIAASGAELYKTYRIYEKSLK